MDDMESQKFENAFKDVFADAEVEPSENVWNNIELDLARAERGELKRGILFYKLLAAASVTFAMCVAGMGYYMVQHNNAVNEEKLSLHERTIESLMAEERKLATKSEATNVDESFELQASVADQQTSSSGMVRNITTNNVDKDKQSSHRDFAGYDNSEHSNGYANADDEMISGVPNHSMGSGTLDITESSNSYASNIHRLPQKISVDMNKPSKQTDPFEEMMLRLKREELAMQEEDESQKKKSKSENLWTSVGFAAGGFNTVSSGKPNTSSSFASVAANDVAEHQSEASGVAYTASVSLGAKLSSRWILQGGLNYIAQSSDYTADAVVTSDYENFQAGSVNKMQSADGEFLASAPYSVNNNMQYISLPLQAGYLVVDRKFGVQVNAGISTDLFLRNTLTPESDALSKTTQSRGEDSPYRPLNFSGLVGTELSYRLGDHYRLALNPGIRYPFNSIYKSELGIKAMPLTFDVGLKFRYIFN